MIKINVPMCILMNIIGILITYTIAVIILELCQQYEQRRRERGEEKKNDRSTIDAMMFFRAISRP